MYLNNQFTVGASIIQQTERSTPSDLKCNSCNMLCIQSEQICLVIHMIYAVISYMDH